MPDRTIRARQAIKKSFARGSDGKLNLGKAAELLEMSRLELERELKEKGVPVRHLIAGDVAAEVEAIKEW